MKKPPQILVIGHRGVRKGAPENTLTAFRRALKLGVTMVEFDVQATLDRRLVVIHDDTIDRTTDGAGTVERMTFRRVRAFKCEDGRPIPALQEVLALLKGRCRANIEFKTRRTARLSAAYFDRRPISEYLFSSFDWTALSLFRTARPDAALGVLFDREPLDRVFAEARRMGAVSIHPPAARLGAGFMKRAGRLDLKVYVWGVRNHADMLKCLRMKAAGFFADEPASALRLVNSPGWEGR